MIGNAVKVLLKVVMVTVMICTVGVRSDDGEGYLEAAIVKMLMEVV